jgi:hypothetical protein
MLHNTMHRKSTITRFLRRFGYYQPISFILLLFFPSVFAKPKVGAIGIDAEFGTGIVWDGYALQEKQISEAFGFGITVDSAGYRIDSHRLRYHHWAFNPAADISVYVHPWVALGAGYQYRWIDQRIDTPHRLENNPGGRRLCSAHTARFLALCSIPLNEKDAVDIMTIPFYTVGSLTRIPLALNMYTDLVDRETLDFLEEIHDPVSFKGYGFELRVRGRHFLNKYLFAHGSFQCQVQKTNTEKDPFGEDLLDTPQGNFGLTLGLGIMFGNEIPPGKKEKRTGKFGF